VVRPFRRLGRPLMVAAPDPVRLASAVVVATETTARNRTRGSFVRTWTNAPGSFGLRCVRNSFSGGSRRMATARVDEDRAAIRGTSSAPRSRGVDETKWALKTTEIVAYLATVVAVLLASKVDDSLDGRGAWQLVTALTVGYLLSRGLAKSGSRHREDRDTI
jgi:hypothetical protein